MLFQPGLNGRHRQTVVQADDLAANCRCSPASRKSLPPLPLFTRSAKIGLLRENCQVPILAVATIIVAAFMRGHI